MILPDMRHGFSRSLSADPARLHFAAHSHHLWPDVSFEAQQAAWLDAATLADRKWEKVFGVLIPELQERIAAILHLPDAATIAFAPNTHEFVLRLLSCFPYGRKFRILTTDSEFHSFDRQIRRLEEDRAIDVTRIATRPFSTFSDRFSQAAAQQDFDMVFFSHVFFDSGFVVTALADIVGAVKNPDSLVVIDGYHGFMALPTDLSAVARRAFYLAGGYKYAMSGEGGCFMHCPPGFGSRPRNTGWYAAFGNLGNATKEGAVAYGSDGTRFSGATFDPTALYRMHAVLGWLAREGVSVTRIRAHAMALQTAFVHGLERSPMARKFLSPDWLLLPPASPQTGNFLVFSTDRSAAIHQNLLEKQVITDVRGANLRLGFGLYQGGEDVTALLERLEQPAGLG